MGKSRPSHVGAFFMIVVNSLYDVSDLQSTSKLGERKGPHGE